MVKIRLMRVGKKKQPMWRVVVADSRSPRDGRIIESIGHYQPRQEPSLVNIDNERALYWLQQGAQPSSSVRHLLQISGAWTDFTGEPAKTLPGEAGEAAPKLSKKKKATVAASVTEEGGTEETPAEETPAEETPAEETPAEVPEAVDQEAAAPDAEPDSDAKPDETAE